MQQGGARGGDEVRTAGGAQVSPERTFAPSTRDRISGVRGGPGAPPGNVRRRHRNATAEETCSTDGRRANSDGSRAALRRTVKGMADLHVTATWGLVGPSLTVGRA